MRAFEPQRATLGKCRRRAGLALIAGAVLLAACSDKEAELTGYQLEPMADVGDIRLPDVANGDTQQALRARPDGLLIVFLGFTNCPDVCPATMTNIGFAVKRTKAAPVEVAMVTVDPERDRGESFAAYVRQFVPDGHALRPGSADDLDRLVVAIGAQYEVVEHTDHDADVGHTSYAYVVDDAGTVQLVWTNEMAAADMAHDLEILQDRLYGE